MISRSTCAIVGVALSAALITASPARAVHFFEGCGPGNLTPAPEGSAAVVLVGPGAAFTDTSSGNNITVVGVGDTVTWIWNDVFCHSVTSVTFWTSSPDGQFSTDGSGDGQSTGTQDQWMVEASGAANGYSVTFPLPGIFWYRCQHHHTIGMRGVVIVIAP